MALIEMRFELNYIIKMSKKDRLAGLMPFLAYRDLMSAEGPEHIYTNYMICESQM